MHAESVPPSPSLPESRPSWDRIVRYPAAETRESVRYEVRQDAVSKLTFIDPPANSIRPLPRLFIRFPSPDLALVLHRIFPCLLADIFACNRGRGGRRGLCGGDSAGMSRRRGRWCAHLGGYTERSIRRL
jgi:hypothetical protein